MNASKPSMNALVSSGHTYMLVPLNNPDHNPSNGRKPRELPHRKSSSQGRMQEARRTVRVAERGHAFMPSTWLVLGKLCRCTQTRGLVEKNTPIDIS